MISINSFKFPDQITIILSTLQSNGYPSFLVGGCVRDLLLGREPKDFDICTKATPEQVKNIFPKVIDTGIKYGTVTVLSDNLAVEITTFRQIVSNPDGARASDIVFGTNVSEDVAKRDFTINGLLFDGEKLIDLVGGKADLEQKIIRAIENPDARFREDPLRMIRAIRFCCQLGFIMDPQTLIAIKRNAELIVYVSPERIREELNKILLSNRPAAGFRLLYQTELLNYFLPELDRCHGFEQQNPHHTEDVFGHIMTVLENTPAQLNIRWAALLHDIGKPVTFSVDEAGIGHFYDHHLKGHDLAKEILVRLRFDNKFIREVSLLVKEHMSKLKSPQRSTLKRLINRVGIENIDDLLELQMADVKRPDKMNEVEELLRIKARVKEILQEKEPMSPRDLAINGHDLKGLGIQPGRLMGRILSELMDKVIDNPELNTRENLLELVKKMELDLEGSHNDERSNHQ